MDGKVKGFYLVEHIEEVRKKLGSKGVEKLKELAPSVNIDRLSRVKDYPIDWDLKLLEATVELLFGKRDAQGWYKMGRLDFEITKRSSLGRVLFMLFKRDPQTFLQQGIRVFNFFATQPVVSYKDLTSNSVTLVVSNDPYPKEYYQGIFEAAVEHTNNNLEKMEMKDIAPDTHQYKIKWSLKNDN